MTIRTEIISRQNNEPPSGMPGGGFFPGGGRIRRMVRRPGSADRFVAPTQHLGGNRVLAGRFEGAAAAIVRNA
jgi:hypothetical protein